MAFYEYRCATCGAELSVRAPMGEATPPQHCGRVAQRVYSPLRSIIMWDGSTYVERAARGEETVPGMSQEEVRATLARW